MKLAYFFFLLACVSIVAAERPTVEGGVSINTGDTPSVEGGASINAGDTPTVEGGASINTGDTPTVEGGTSISAGDTPSIEGGASINTGDTPSVEGGAAINAGDTPTVEGGASINAGDAPTVEGGASINTGDTPTVDGGASINTGDTPTVDVNTPNIDLSECLDILQPNDKMDPIDKAVSIKKCLKVIKPSMEHREEMEKMKKQLPLALRILVFNDDFCIKVKKYDQYFYTPKGGYVFNGTDPVQRHVFTYVYKWKHPKKGDWRFEYAGSGTFHLIAAETGEYLTATDDLDDRGIRRRVMAALEPTDGSKWRLSLDLPAEDMKKGVVQIVSNKYDEFMYAVASESQFYDKGRRNVFTWGVDKECERDPKCEWKIMNC